jgi:hypothetical protein
MLDLRGGYDEGNQDQIVAAGPKNAYIGQLSWRTTLEEDIVAEHHPTFSEPVVF